MFTFPQYHPEQQQKYYTYLTFQIRETEFFEEAAAMCIAWSTVWVIISTWRKEARGYQGYRYNNENFTCMLLRGRLTCFRDKGLPHYSSPAFMYITKKNAIMLYYSGASQGNKLLSHIFK